MKYIYLFSFLWAFSCKCYAIQKTEKLDSINDYWTEISAPFDSLEGVMTSVPQEQEALIHISKSNIALFKHRCSTDSVQFYCFRNRCLIDPVIFHIYIKIDENENLVSTFEEMTDYVFSTMHKGNASSALNVIKAYAIHECIYNYYETEALKRYESEDFNAVQSLYSPSENSTFLFDYNFCPSSVNVDGALKTSKIERQSWLEKWQIYAYKQVCEYEIYSVYSNNILNVELIQSKVGDKYAYALAFISSKPTMFELNNSQSYISIQNKKTKKNSYIENLTYLAIVMEILDSPYIETDQEKYQLIQRIRYLREIIGVQGKYIPQDN